MASSVGAKTLTLRQAVLVSAVFEFAGAFFLGSHVTDTIRKGEHGPCVTGGRRWAQGAGPATSEPPTAATDRRPNLHCAIVSPAGIADSDQFADRPDLLVRPRLSG